MLEEIKIGWKKYKINKISPVYELIHNWTDCYGQIDYDKYVINLNENYSNDQNTVTLIHEVLHGISDMYQLKLEEETILVLADTLFTVLKDNEIELTKNNREKSCEINAESLTNANK